MNHPKIQEIIKLFDQKFLIMVDALLKSGVAKSFDLERYKAIDRGKLVGYLLDKYVQEINSKSQSLAGSCGLEINDIDVNSEEFKAICDYIIEEMLKKYQTKK